HQRILAASGKHERDGRKEEHKRSHDLCDIAVCKIGRNEHHDREKKRGTASMDTEKHRDTAKKLNRCHEICPESAKAECCKKGNCPREIGQFHPAGYKENNCDADTKNEESRINSAPRTLLEH